MNIPQTLIDLEMELVSSSTRANAERLNELIAEDFEEFGSSGRVITKSDVLKGAGPLSKYELSAFSVRLLGDKAALVKYRACTSAQRSYRSSVWVKHEDKWQMLHHQSTVAPSDA